MQRCKRHGFNCWVRKIPWRKAWQPTPVFLPGESHGQRSLWTTVHRVTKSQRRLKQLSIAQHLFTNILYKYNIYFVHLFLHMKRVTINYFSPCSENSSYSLTFTEIALFIIKVPDCSLPPIYLSKTLDSIYAIISNFTPCLKLLGGSLLPTE